ncbi:MAG: DUF1573 domain-containing protein [Bacteroidales bacterium]|nr:DUF1573 domain-containing protein [Bacteroidales bacterium]
MRRIFFCLVVATLSVLTAACGPRSESADVSLITNPSSASGYDSTAAVAHMSFDCNMHDFGRLSSGETVSYGFHFRNTGKANLIINGCDATCGCTVADYPRKVIAPGEDGYITVTFSSVGRTGQQIKEVTVNSNAQPATTRLRIVAQVI